MDGTDGNTYLKSVEARLQSSTIQASGEITRMPGAPGRHILLDASSNQSRIEDLLRLAVKGDRPLMKGAATLRAHIDIPPGDEDISERMTLHGEFGVAGGHFTNPGVQGKLDSLSRRGQGQPKDEDIQDVISNLRAAFVMRNAVITFSKLLFNVRGAAVELSGTYNLESEAIDFHGHLFIDAKLSQMTTGAKSVVLKFFDPFFKKKGGNGSSIPIRVGGTRTQPIFGLNLHAGDVKRQTSQPARH